MSDLRPRPLPKTVLRVVSELCFWRIPTRGTAAANAAANARPDRHPRLCAAGNFLRLLRRRGPSGLDSQSVVDRGCHPFPAIHHPVDSAVPFRRNDPFDLANFSGRASNLDAICKTKSVFRSLGLTQRQREEKLGIPGRGYRPGRPSSRAVASVKVFRLKTLHGRNHNHRSRRALRNAGPRRLPAGLFVETSASTRGGRAGAQSDGGANTFPGLDLL